MFARFNPHIADAQTPWTGTPYRTLKFTLGLPSSVLVALGPACTLLVRRCGAVPVRRSHLLSPVPCDTRMFQVAAGLHRADTKYQITACVCACALQEVPPVSTCSTTSWFRLLYVRLQTFLGAGSWHSLSRTVGLLWTTSSDRRY